MQWDAHTRDSFRARVVELYNLLDRDDRTVPAPPAFVAATAGPSAERSGSGAGCAYSRGRSKVSPPNTKPCVVISEPSPVLDEREE